MKDKLILILSFTTVFALGCATASVLVTRAEAGPAAGQEQCAAFYLGQPISLDKSKDLDADIAKHGRVLPPGWHGIGGGGREGTPYSMVVACRKGE